MREKWDVVLDLATEKVRVLYSRDDEIYTSALRLNKQGEKRVFAQEIDWTADGSGEHLFYDSGLYDEDIDWVVYSIVFTSGSKV
jgi:hypothetical protein